MQVDRNTHAVVAELRQRQAARTAALAALRGTNGAARTIRTGRIVRARTGVIPATRRTNGGRR